MQEEERRRDAAEEIMPKVSIGPYVERFRKAQSALKARSLSHMSTSAEL